MMSGGMLISLYRSPSAQLREANLQSNSTVCHRTFCRSLPDHVVSSISSEKTNFSTSQQLLKMLTFVTLGIGAITFPYNSRGKELGTYAVTTEIIIPGEKPLPEKETVGEKAMYALDYFFATKPSGKVIILLTVCAILTMVGGVLYYKFSDQDESGEDLPESMWTAWSFIANSGAHIDQDTIRKRLVAVPISIAGMFFYALLVGLVTDAVSSKVDQLSRGSSRVLEKNHTLIIGWTNKTLPLVKELSTANKARVFKNNIVIMGSLDKEEMDKILYQSLPLLERFGTKVITRNGSPESGEDLRQCSASMARSIIILSPPELSPLEADAEVLQTSIMLAQMREIQANIVAELAELDNVSELRSMVSTLLPLNLPNASIANMTRGRKLVPVAAGDAALRVMVKIALQPDVIVVLKELLQFDGSEFHFNFWPQLVGKRFGEVIFLFEECIPCGIKPADSCKTLLNPSHDTILKEGDKLLVISKDESSYMPGSSSKAICSPTLQMTTKTKKPKLKVLIVGWRNDLAEMLILIDSSVSKGSEVTLFSEVGPELRSEELSEHLMIRTKLINRYGSPFSIKALEKLPLETYDKVIILMDHTKRTPLVAMYIRHIQLLRGRKDSTIVAESEDSRTWLDDAIHPDYIEAMVLANVAEDAEIGSVLDEVLNNSSGSNLVVKDISKYADEGEELNFWELQERAVQRGEIIVALRYENSWKLNPDYKSEKLRWSSSDAVIVLTPHSD